MANLSLPPPNRIAVGSVMVKGQRLDVVLNPEWARYFEALNTQANITISAVGLPGAPGTTGAAGAAVSFVGSDGEGSTEFIPGPPGAQGPQGEPGPALFMLAEQEADASLMILPPAATAAGGVPVINQPAPTSKAAAATLTAAEVLVGLIQYTGAAANLTFPTAANLDAAITLAVDGAFDISVLNTGSGTATMVTNTGLTLVGAATVAASAAQRFRIRKTATTPTFSIYRA